MAEETPKSTDTDPAQGDQIRLKSDVSFMVDEETKTLYALLTPSPTAQSKSLTQLQFMMRPDGYDECQFIEGALESLQTKILEGEKGRFPIGEQKDAELSLVIAKDKTTAIIDILPAHGGKKISSEDIQAALTKKGVVNQCLCKDTIKEVIANTQQNRMVRGACIAKAIPPKRGQSAKFKSLIEDDSEVHPKTKEDGAVDLKEIHDFLVIEAGVPLVRRQPPTEGTPGTDILGEPITPEPGADLPFADAKEGVAIDSKDENLLVSAIKGHPVILAQGARVDPVLKLKNVDVATGNIHFDGSIEITGNVESGFEVTATGDVLVRGLVEHAIIKAGGNIEINGGVVGEGDWEDESIPLSAELKAEGSISAKFVNLASIDAGSDIRVREYIIQSRTRANGDILLGQDGGKGCLIGGCTHASHSLIANVLGSDAYIPTPITAGASSALGKELIAYQCERTRRQAEYQQLKTIFDKIKNSNRKEKLGSVVLNKAKKIHNTIAAIANKIEELNKTIAQLESKLASFPEPQVEAKRKVFPGVSVLLTGSARVVNYHCDKEANAAVIDCRQQEQKTKGKGSS